MSTRTGPRIVKPRSQKQRDAAHRYSRRASPMVIVSKTTGLPSSSWWASAPREGFTQEATVHWSRMRYSHFGSILNPSFAETV